MISEINQLLQGFSKYLQSKGKQAATISSYTTDSTGFLLYLAENSCDFRKAGSNLLYQYTKELRHKKKETQNSIRRKIIGIRQFYHYLQLEQEIESNPFLANAIPKRDESLPEELSFEHIQTLITIAGEHSSAFKSSRDPAIIALLALEGVKVTEIVALKNSHLILSREQPSLLITGLRKRVITLDPKTADLLTNYKTFLRKRNTNKPDSHLFLALKGKEQINTLAKITRHGLKFLLYELGAELGFDKLNTELLRHHAINYLLQKKQSLQAVQEHLGLKQGGNIIKHINRKNIESRENI